MQFLFVSNFYPPFARGGYEQWCEEVAAELRRRAHRVAILTSRPGLPPKSSEDDGEVRRLLNLEVEGGVARTALRLLKDRNRREADNLEYVRRVVDEIRPDVAVIWGMWNIPRSVPTLIEQLLPRRIVYYLCDYWPSLPSAYVQQLNNPSARLATQIPKRIIARPLMARLARDEPIPLRLEHPICVSRAVRELLMKDGVPIEHAQIIHGGIQVDDFEPGALRRWERRNGGLRLLYAGRLTEEKGVHTAVRAMARICPRLERPVTLDLVGNGEARYRAMLQDTIQDCRLAGSVRFRESVPRVQVPALLAEYDALIFPSEWQEPFARMVLEAMAVGLVVVGTTTGGTGDVLVEGETGLTFPAGDGDALARQIERLRDNRTLGQRLAIAGRQMVERQFSFTRMVDEIEADLRRVAPNGAN